MHLLQLLHELASVITAVIVYFSVEFLIINLLLMIFNNTTYFIKQFIIKEIYSNNNKSSNAIQFQNFNSYLLISYVDF